MNNNDIKGIPGARIGNGANFSQFVRFNVDGSSVPLCISMATTDVVSLNEQSQRVTTSTRQGTICAATEAGDNYTRGVELWAGEVPGHDPSLKATLCAAGLWAFNPKHASQPFAARHAADSWPAPQWLLDHVATL